MASHQQNDDSKQSSGRGFSGMDPAKQHEAASKGGHASHQGGQNQPPAHGTERDDQSHLKLAESQTGGQTRGGTSEQHAKAGAQSHKNK
jgi:hypothetical protein